MQQDGDHTKCVACPLGTFRNPGSDNSCQNLAPGMRASVTQYADLGLAAVTLATDNGVPTASLADVVVDPSGAPYFGPFKTGLTPCALGTEAYGLASARLPAPANGSYAAAVVADQSCSPCAPYLFASKLSTAKCQICRAGMFATKSFAPGTAPEVSGAERGPDQCTPW